MKQCGKEAAWASFFQSEMTILILVLCNSLRV